MRLLNPGPVTLTERVRRSLLQPDLCHRESEFFDLQEEVRAPAAARCTASSANEWTAVLLSGSGTARGGEHGRVPGARGRSRC